MIQLLFKLLLGINIVTISLKQMGYTWLVRPLKKQTKKPKRLIHVLKEINKHKKVTNIFIYL